MPKGWSANLQRSIAMSALNELIEILINFTPEQLEQFLKHEVTSSILQAARAQESYPLAVPLEPQ